MTHLTAPIKWMQEFVHHFPSNLHTSSIKGLSKTNSWVTFLADLQVIKDVPTSTPKSDLLGVTVALVHVAAQQFLAVRNGLNHTNWNLRIACVGRQLQAMKLYFLYSKVVPHFWIDYRWYNQYMRWFSAEMPRDAAWCFSQNDHRLGEPSRFACPPKLFRHH